MNQWVHWAKLSVYLAFRVGSKFTVIPHDKKIFCVSLLGTPPAKAIATYIDDQLVVNQIGISMKSTHCLTVNGDRLLVTFGYRRFMSEIFLEAKVGDEMVYDLNHRPRDNVKPATFIAATLAIALIGAGVGYLIGNWLQRLAG